MKIFMYVSYVRKEFKWGFRPLDEEARSLLDRYTPDGGWLADRSAVLLGGAQAKALRKDLYYARADVVDFADPEVLSGVQPCSISSPSRKAV